MNKLKWIKFFSFLAAPAIAVPALTSCFSSGSPINHINFLANYVNSLDANSLLGVAPHHFISNKSSFEVEKFIENTYLKDYFNHDKTKVNKYKIMDGQEVNLKDIARLEPYSILFNEWERVDENKFHDIIPHIAYTSMGDTENQSRWWQDDKEETFWYTKDESMLKYYQYTDWNNTNTYQSERVKLYATVDSGVSPQKALLMAAKDLDKIYNLNGALTKRANDSVMQFKNRVTAITNNEYFKTFVSTTSQTVSDNQNSDTHKNNINVGVVLGGASDNSSTWQFLTPNALPLFYSSQQGKGLGFNFPDPKDNTHKFRFSHYNETYIKSTSSTDELFEQFKNKFDYLIYVQSDTNTVKNNTPNLEGFDELLKEPKIGDFKKRIYSTTNMKFYDAIWGMIGYEYILNDLVDKMIPQFTSSQYYSQKKSSVKIANSNSLIEEDKKNRWNLIKPQDFVYLTPNMDKTIFKEWNYNKNSKKENE